MLLILIFDKKGNLHFHFNFQGPNAKYQGEKTVLLNNLLPYYRFKPISWNIDDFTRPTESSGLRNSSIPFTNQSRNSVVIRSVDLLKWSYQVASGMEYLGQKKVIFNSHFILSFNMKNNGYMMNLGCTRRSGLKKSFTY